MYNHTVCSSDVNVIKRKNNSHPDDTDTDSVLVAVICSVADVISSLNLAIVPAISSISRD